MLLVLLGILAAYSLNGASGASYGYFTDTSCTDPEFLHIEDECTTGECEASPATSTGYIYKKKICVQSDNSILSMFSKETKIFISAEYDDSTCTKLASATVKIADGECHRVSPTHSYRVDVNEKGIPMVYSFGTDDCSGNSYFSNDYERLDRCLLRHKWYLANGTGKTSTSNSPLSEMSDSGLKDSSNHGVKKPRSSIHCFVGVPIFLFWLFH
ncbi:unnamed protein product [Phytophthora fragariaefolia]|uniref:Unnamed protein product n=1 Tax=Phytophthora fragariaefolia TaxID=1490495 RepID=A0A9W6Y174_9STRA|nr:unnamed protein product [Phytophthora fragariaefolia]